MEQKERLARVNDMGLEAAAIRLRAARKSISMAQQDLARAAGIGKTTLNNAEAGLTYVGREVLSYLWRAHRIDFNFLMNGNFAQLPGDVQTALFPALEAATSEWDQREGSSRSQTKPKRAQP